MSLNAYRHQDVYVEQISHGKSERISATSSLAKTGAFLPALNIGRPVSGSLTSHRFGALLFRDPHHSSSLNARFKLIPGSQVHTPMDPLGEHYSPFRR